MPARIVNRDFARYNVVLQAASDNAALRLHLTARAGMPAALVPRVLGKLPVVESTATFDTPNSRPWSPELAEAGAEASAEPLAFQRFNLALGEVRDVRPLVPVLSAVSRAWTRPRP